MSALGRKRTLGLGDQALTGSRFYNLLGADFQICQYSGLEGYTIIIYPPKVDRF